MTWAHPLVLGVIPLALAASWWCCRRAGAAGGIPFARIRRLWADADGLRSAPPATARRARGLLLAAGVCLALAALARPQWGSVEERQGERSREVLLALDLSRSMLAGDVAPSRLERARLLIDSMLDQLRGERVGLVVFAGTAFLQSPMSPDYEVLRDFLRELAPEDLPQGGTNYGAMLETALRSFGRGDDSDRYLVVLSDGEAHDDAWRSSLAALRQRGIRVVALGVGTAEGELVPDGAGGFEKDERGAAVLSRLEPDTLRELAAATGGDYRDAALWVDLAELIGATVAQGRAGLHAERVRSRPLDRFQWLLAPAVLLLLLSFAYELPAVPVARKLRRPARGMAPVRAAASTAALLLALATAGSARAAMPASPPSPLVAAVADLVARESLAATDFAHFAEMTIEQVSAPDSIDGGALAGVVGDALAGVERGEQLDSAAADWPDLRRRLEELARREDDPPAENPETPPCDQGQQDDSAENESGGESDPAGGNQGDEQSEDRSENEAGENDETAEGNDGGSGGADSAENDGGDAAGSAAAPDAANGEDVSQASPSTDATAAQTQAADAPADTANRPSPGGTESGENEEHAAAPEPQPLDDDSARIGALEDTEPPAPQADAGEERPAPRPMQLVGGGSVQRGSAGGDEQLQRVVDADSPATLFDRLGRAEGRPPLPPPSKNW